jgi:hypothetical protein
VVSAAVPLSEPAAKPGSSMTLVSTFVGSLPTAPARLLLLGEQTQALAEQLAALGYSVVAMPVLQSKDYAQFPSPTRQGICQVELLLSQAEIGRFAAGIVLGLTPQVHPLALFEELSKYLASEAVVILTSALEASDSPRMSRWLEHVVSIGRRCGWAEAFAEPDILVQPGDGFTRILRREGATRWEIRHVRSRDFDGIATLFHEVFGHSLSRALWDWKYAQGRGNAVVAVRHGTVIAHYGGMYRDVMLCGQPDWTFQICDVMVHPKERGVMTRQGPFLLTAATSAEIYGPLGFGFPNARAMQVAEKMGLYSEVGQMASVRWEPSRPRFRWQTRVRAVEHASATGRAQVNALWSEMAHDLRDGVVGVRDWDYVEHRYFSHPHNRYEVLVVTARLTGKALGAMVLRRDGEACELLDVITPLANLPLVIDQARRLTGLWGLTHVYCWITKNHVQRFVDCGGVQGELNVTIPTSCWTDDPRANVFKDKWWLMSGDTDFR